MCSKPKREERAGESGKVRKSSTNFHAPRAGKGHVKPRTNAAATAVNNIARAQHHTTRCWTTVYNPTILRLSSLQLPFFPASLKLFLTHKKVTRVNTPYKVALKSPAKTATKKGNRQQFFRALASFKCFSTRFKRFLHLFNKRHFLNDFKPAVASYIKH